jgi:hypothetical protein
MRRLGVGVLGVLAVVGGAGCAGSAVLIGRTPNGGILGLDGDRETAMGDARRQMSEQCDGAYTIVAERNVLAGAFHGRSLTEHQVRFICGVHAGGQLPGP